MRERLLVKCVGTHDCFVRVSDTWLRQRRAKSDVIKVIYHGETYFLSYIPRHSADGTLFVGATFAKVLNINDNDELFVSIAKEAPSLKYITVIPRTNEDHEILELQSDKVQSTLLNQVRVVAKHQPIVVWVSQFSSIILDVEKLEPNVAYGKLEEFTEVHVLNKSTENVEEFNLINSFKRTISNFLQMEHHQHDIDHVNNRALLQSFRDKSEPCVFRVHFLPKFESFNPSNMSDIDLKCPYNIFVPRKHLPKNIKFTNSNVIICKIRKISEDRQVNSATNTNFLRKEESSFSPPSELTVKLLVLESILEKCSDYIDKNYFNLNYIHSNVYVSECVRKDLQLEIGSKIVVSLTDNLRQSAPTTIEIFPRNETMSLHSFEDFVKTRSAYEKILLNSYSNILLDDGTSCLLKFFPSNCTYAFFDETTLKNTVISLKPKQNNNIIAEKKLKNVAVEKISVRSLENVIFECQNAINLSLGLNRGVNFKYDRENILICGETGSGKSTMCKILMKKLQDSPYFVYTRAIECRSLKGKKVEILQKVVNNEISRCIYHQPSILFFEDIENVTLVSSNDEENTPDSINAARITDMIINSLTKCQETHYVIVIATCNSVTKIGQKMRPTRGGHFFRTVLSLPTLEKADRINILQLMLEDKLHVARNVNWDYYGNKTEGWMAQDLVDLAEKATFAAWKRHVKENLNAPVVITDELISSILKDYKPLSLQGVQLYKGSGYAWTDIGGLAEVKKSLIEILHWPLKYPEIFKNAPIKLQSGILLYGMPGTGKTLLAKAIANECGVNLISVKGPELLSKYIGVSEESVRNVFERAQRAKPCVLFFDEFDSLAPRRGHDSTGVTDRVVNQLLTQLDGVEDREGVAVVAATSRPDLLDPALLRPGRLDKSLFCPLPDEVDREKILFALCNTQHVNTNELDLKEIASMSSGFTGADLNAVITQARLAAFEDAVEVASEGKVQPEDVTVSQKHLVESVKSTQPSLSSAEKAKYTKIYARFSKGETFTEDVLKNQKATLA